MFILMKKKGFAVDQINEDDLPFVSDWANTRLNGLESQFYGFDNSLSAGEKQALMTNDIIEVYCQLRRKGIAVDGCISDMAFSDCN